MFKSKSALKSRIEIQEAIIEKMEERCSEHQATVEVMAEALQRKDQDVLDLITKLHMTMGGESEPDSFEDCLIRLRQLRSWADKYLAIREVMGGRFNADQDLLRRLACSLGCATWDTETVIGRAGILSSAHAKNAGLFRELTAANQKIEELESFLS